MSRVIRYLSIAVVAALLALTTACGDSEEVSSSPPPPPDSSSENQTKPISISYPLRYKVSSVSEFRQLRGQAQWTNDSRARMSGSTWVFNQDGSFTVAANANLFPLRGTFTTNGNMLSFNATGRNANAGGTSFTLLNGSVDLSTAKPVVSGTWGSGATYGAVVNDTQFASATQSEYQFSFVMMTN